MKVGSKNAQSGAQFETINFFPEKKKSYDFLHSFLKIVGYGVIFGLAALIGCILAGCYMLLTDYITNPELYHKNLGQF